MSPFYSGERNVTSKGERVALLSNMQCSARDPLLLPSLPTPKVVFLALIAGSFSQLSVFIGLERLSP